MDQSLVVPWFDKEDQRKYTCVMWNLTRRCGAGCEYCPFHEDSAPFSSYENVNNILKWIYVNIPKERLDQWSQLTLFGGEPTLHPNFMHVINSAAVIPFKQIVVYTNFSADLNLYLQMLIIQKIMIVATFHEQQISHKAFVLKMMSLLGSWYPASYIFDHVRVNVMSSDPNHEYVATVLRTAGFTVNIAEPHRHGQSHDSHTHNTTTVVDTSGWNKLVKGNKNHFKGWNCLAGRNNVYIEENGDLFPCQSIGQAAYLKKPDAQPRITNILHDPNFEWKDLPATVCPMKACRFELFLTKYK